MVDTKFKREVVGREVIGIILSKKPWLIPILYEIKGYGEISFSELREGLGIRSYVLKRALWWLKRYGLIQQISENKFVVTRDYNNIIEELVLNTCKVRHYYVVKIGATYIVINVKKTKISTYTVPSQLITKVRELESNIGAPFTDLDIAQALNIPLKLAHRVTKTLRLLSNCKL